jgi:pyruvate/2-oxoglutarate/acetoin dehydrogenase E1 component
VTASVGTQIEFADAVAEALRMEMHRDPTIVCVSAAPGRATNGLADAFGSDRVIHTPAVGAPIILAATGAAEEGMRVVCELGPGEGGSAALEQIAELGAIHAGSKAASPLAVRITWGDPLAGGGAAGSDPLGFLLGSEGLQVVEPATPADAKGLTVAAVRSDEPVCVLEHVSLLERVGAVPEGAHEVEIGRARLALEGERLTVIAHGVGVAPAERAIDERGIDADLLDLRTLQPLDTDAVLTSVRKTGRVLFVESAVAGGRVTSALVSAIWEHAFEHLDAPPKRVRISAELINGAGPDDGIGAIGSVCDELLLY